MNQNPEPDPTSVERAPEEGLRERVEALIVAAESRVERSLSRTFDGGTFPATVDAAALRRALAASEAAPTAGECPTCGPTETEPHPRRNGVIRCGNCKEWLTAPPTAEPDAGDVRCPHYGGPLNQCSICTGIDS